MMPFGKHRGKPFHEIPTDYLDWVIGLDDLDPIVEEQITGHLKTRPDWGEENSAPDVDVCPKCVNDLTDVGYCKTCDSYPFRR